MPHEPEEKAFEITEVSSFVKSTGTQTNSIVIPHAEACIAWEIWNSAPTWRPAMHTTANIAATLSENAVTPRVAASSPPEITLQVNDAPGQGSHTAQADAATGTTRWAFADTRGNETSPRANNVVTPHVAASSPPEVTDDALADHSDDFSLQRIVQPPHRSVSPPAQYAATQQQRKKEQKSVPRKTRNRWQQSWLPPPRRATTRVGCERPCI